VAVRLSIAGFDEVHRVDCAGTPAFVALHAVLRGRSFGGIRIRRYASEDDALADALALARTMSRKVVMAGIAGGGAKSVLVEPPPGRREAAVTALGEFIQTLAGRYHCGADYGFTPADDAVLRRATKHVA
jgi:glutamate dehydrogenase/leucine dehydrogenase